MKNLIFFSCFFLFTISLCDESVTETSESPSQQEFDENEVEFGPISINISVTNIHDARSNNKTDAEQNQKKSSVEEKKKPEENMTSLLYKKGISIAKTIFSPPAYNWYKLIKNGGIW